MVDAVTGLAAAWESMRAVGGLVKVAKDSAVDIAVKERLIEIQSAILDAQQKLGDAQADRVSLLDQLAQAQARVRELEAARTAVEDYELGDLGEGKKAYRFKGSGAAHFACPTCFAARRVSPLQVSASGNDEIITSVWPASSP